MFNIYIIGTEDHPTIIAFAFLHWGATYEDYRTHMDYFQLKVQGEIKATEVFDSEEKFIFGTDGNDFITLKQTLLNNFSPAQL
jgi:hypothetical protein